MKLTQWIMPLLLLPSLASAVSTQAEQNIKNTVARLAPGVVVTSVKESPIAGLYEVAAGPLVLYVSADGKYLIQGTMIDVETGKNLSKPAKQKAIVSAIDSIGEDNMIVYEPIDTKYTVNVFTDINCGYCRRLHKDMEGYLKNGIKIRYLFYPRAGLASSAAGLAESVWCADDQKKAMTDAKAGKDIASLNCKNPVAEHHSLGELINLTGTPTLVLEDGETVPGYVPPEKLKAYLDKKAKGS